MTQYFGDDNLSETITGSTGDDEIYGGSSTLGGGFASDTLLALDGNDVLVGGRGGDLLDGGAGDDTFYGYDYDTFLSLDLTGSNDAIVAYFSYENFGTQYYGNTYGSTAVIDRSLMTDSLTLSYDSAINKFSLSGGGFVTTVWGAQILKVTGGLGDDLLGDASLANLGYGTNLVLDGGAGNDTLTGGIGASDTLISRDLTGSDDVLDGGNLYSAADMAIIDRSGMTADLVLGFAADGSVHLDGGGYTTVIRSIALINMTSGAGNDLLNTLGGPETIHAGDGTDTINGIGFSSGWLYGDAGDDQISLGALYTSDSHLFGGDGDDLLKGPYVTGGSEAYGGTGDDTVVGVFVRVEGGEGDDWLDLTLLSGEGLIDLADPSQSDAAISGFEHYKITLSGGRETLIGTDGADTILGAVQGDDIRTGGGDDVLDFGINYYSGNPRAFVDAGDGNDSLTLTSYVLWGGTRGTYSGGAGDDQIAVSGRLFYYGSLTGSVFDGGTGNDSVTYDLGNLSDTLAGGDGAGSDVLHLTASVGTNLVLDLSSGGGHLQNGATDLVLRGFEALDLSLTGTGNDSVTGTAGNDTISGGAGNDSLLGGAGDDGLIGGIGDDRLTPGAGSATVEGGDGQDVLVLDKGIAAYDVVTAGSVTTLTDRLTGAVITASDIEEFQYGNTAPTSGEVTLPALDEDQSLIITAADLLAAAVDVDGDGMTVSGLTVLAGAGTLQDNPDGTWTYQPAANDDSTVRFGFLIADGKGGSVMASAVLDLTPVNDAPTVAGPVDLGNLAEDGSRILTKAQLVAGASDSDGPGLGIANLQASSGVLHDNGDGTWTFTPGQNDDSAVTFTYQVGDGSLAVAQTATLDLTPVNDAPQLASPVDLGSLAEDGSRTLTAAELLAGAADIDGPGLVVLNLQASAGVVQDNGDGTWTFTPAQDATGPVTFTYRVGDGSLSVAQTATLDLTPVNDTPVGVDDNLAATRGVELVISAAQLLANDRDVDGDTLTIGAVQSVSGGIAKLNDDGSVTFTADPDFLGTQASFTYQSYDGQTLGQPVTVHVHLPKSTQGLILVGTTLDDALTGSKWDDVLSGDTGQDLLNGLAGADVLLGGVGDDTLFGGVGADHLNGGTGNDSLRGDAGADTLVGGDDIDTLSYSVSRAGVTVSLIANDAGLQSASGGDAKGDLVSGFENVTGSALDDVITGDAASNGLTGGAGNDLITGGLGNDLLRGGAGADTFVFDSALGADNIDTIGGYSVADDMIALDSAIFTGLGLGALDPAFFATNTTGLAALATDHIIYQSSTGKLFFDADGVGGEAGQQFAKLAANLAGFGADEFTLV